jgi:adenosylhomocysteine nucleosidase
MASYSICTYRIDRGLSVIGHPLRLSEPMHATCSTLLTVAAHAEAEPLIRRLQLKVAGPGLRSGTHQGSPVHLVCHGIGAERAVDRVAEAIDSLQPDQLITSGVCGALTERLNVGDVVIPRRLIDGRLGERFEPTLPIPTTVDTLVSSSTLAADADSKARLKAAHEADVVDMESAAIGRLCHRRNVRWACVRAVSDTATESVPAAFAQLVDEHGQAKIGTAIVYALSHPGHIGKLIRLGRATKQAAEALADVIENFLDQSATI